MGVTVEEQQRFRAMAARLPSGEDVEMVQEAPGTTLPEPEPEDEADRTSSAALRAQRIQERRAAAQAERIVDAQQERDDNLRRSGRGGSNSSTGLMGPPPAAPIPVEGSSSEDGSISPGTQRALGIRLTRQQRAIKRDEKMRRFDQRREARMACPRLRISEGDQADRLYL